MTGDAAKTAMLAKVEAIIQNAIAVGVYVLVDWHTEKAVSQQADSIAFFAALAQKYGKYPNIIWEPYNEPNGFTWAQIKPYHEAVVDAIRAVDPDNVIVMGTPKWSQDVDVAAADPVAPKSGAKNLMYTLHFYACTHQAKFRDKADMAISKGLALFVTEFGATPADGGWRRRATRTCVVRRPMTGGIGWLKTTSVAWHGSSTRAPIPAAS